MSATAPSAGRAGETHDVVVIGAGISGLCMGVALRERGIHNFLILEKSSQVGGTWHDNSYPGASCDVPSVLYSYSFAPNPGWSRVFSPQAEIHAYLERCAEDFGLRPHLRLNCPVLSTQWREEAGHWVITLSGGGILRARTVVSALGQLNTPQIPEFPGAERFAGRSFHTARWNHDYALEGKRVAVIGNAASALQVIPEIAGRVEQLYVYQRSANFVLRRGDRAYRGWEKRLFQRLPLAQRLARLWVYLRGECLLYPALRLGGTWLSWLLTQRCNRYREKEIEDPGLRRNLTPDYRIGCKRILFSDDYYRALRRSNVELVTAPIRGLNEGGVVSEDGATRPVDVVIYATGFATSRLQSAVDFRGEGGASLQDVWRDGAEAYRSVCAHGFPNFFMLYGPNSNIGSGSIIFMVERQVRYVVDCIDKLLAHDLRALEVSATALRRYNRRLQSDLARTVWASGCDSWYRNAAGKIVNNWPRSTLAYWWHMRSPDFADFDMRA